MNKVIVITGASSGFGALTARQLADAGHSVYAGMRDTATRNAQAVQDAHDYAATHDVQLQPIELDISSQASVDAAIASVLAAADHIDVLVHNAGHMVTGPSEAFSTEELDELFDVNVLGTQRVNRTVLPHFRSQRSGLLVWVSSSSVKGGTRPTSARTSPRRRPWIPSRSRMRVN